MADRTVSVALRLQIADYVANARLAGKSTRDLEAAGRDLRKALDEEDDALGRVRVSEAKLEEIRKSGKASVAQLAAAEEEHTSNLRKAEAATIRTREATERYIKAQKESADEVDNSGKRVEQSLSRVANRANAMFDAKMFLGLSVGLPAAAAIGAAGATAALLVAAGGFAAIGIWAASSNQQVQDQFSDLTRHVQADVQEMAKPITGELTGAIDDMAQGWDAVKPAVQAAVRGSAPAVRELTGAAVDFAENAMPGIVDAVYAAEPAIEGFRDLAGQTGQGLGDFFHNAAKGSEDAGLAMRDLGGITRDLLGQSGTLFANLAAGAHQTLPQFGGALHQVLGVANDITSHGMPTLVSTTSAFLGTVGGGLNLVDAFASGLGAWSAPLGSAGGSLLATNSIAKLFGTSLGETGFGLAAFSTKIDDAGNKTSPFREALDRADKEGNSKFKAGLKSIVSGGFNPLGVAMVAGGLLLDAWGQKSQDAAKKAAEFAATVGDIKGTLSATGAITQNTRVMAANTIATKQLGVSQKTGSDLMSEYGINAQLATDAMTGNKSALDSVTGSLERNVSSVLAGKLSQEDFATAQKVGLTASDLTTLALGKQAHGFKDLGDAIAQYQDKGAAGVQGTLEVLSVLGKVNTATQGQRDLATAIRDQAAATAEAQRQMRQLGNATTFTGGTLRLSAADAAVMSGALSAVGDATKGVGDQGSALLTVLDQLSGKTNTLSAAQAQSTKAFDDADKAIKNIKDSGKKLKGSFQDLVSGDGGINGLTAAGANLQGIFGTLSQAMGTETAAAFAQSQAAGDALNVSFGKVGGVVGRTRDKFIEAARAAGLTKEQAGDLANKLGLVPEQVEVQFAAKGDTQLQARLVGLIADLNKVGEGKSISITADDKVAAQALRDLGKQVVQLPDGSFKVFADTKEGKAAADKLRQEINDSHPVVNVNSNTNQATSKVVQWMERTNGTWGMTSTDSRIDPATGKVQAWMRQANGTWGWTTLDSNRNPANGQVSAWVQFANGKWGWVNLGALTGAANSQIDAFVADQSRRVIRIGVTTYTVDGVGASTSRAYGPRAEGGIDVPRGVVPMAAGGVIPHIPNIATVVPPGMERLIGDNKRVAEAFIPLDPSSARSRAILAEANRRMGNTVQQQILAGSASVQRFAPRIVIQQPAAPARRGGDVPPVTIHTAEADPHRIAAMVSSQLAWILR
ncbi:hypothetical protein [Amycolatopsis echigonensis]|uniref:Uncharacterized protein n=1 Tax=Amycolatopsis echigonensis TaxID=2576905 RepID=A0A8E1W4Y5_9PSEU|nr:hypothetical protein [Amycolatopsis echigonensis]MBB2504324.1 hypothetical protein [Amycolatopsis echigonensis]